MLLIVFIFKDLYTTFMNENKMMVHVVHSRRVYNFMGINLEAQVSFFFFLFLLLCILFKN